jgi:hypothetical protein
MRSRPTDYFCSTSSLAIVMACVSISTSLSAQTVDGKTALQDPQFRQALQRLIKKYQQAEQSTAAVNNVANQPDVADVVQSTQPSSLAEDSQNFDSSAQQIQNAAASDELVEGSRFAEGEELIFGVELTSKNGVTALADVFALKSKTSAQLGFSTFIQLLELPIEVSSDLKRANGWIYNESNKFSFQVDSEQRLAVSANGKSWTLTEQDYRIESDDIYIDIEVIAEWFGFTFDIDESRLKLKLTTERQLPVELRIARQNRQINTQTYSNNSVMPYRDTGYTAFSPPLFDAQISTSHRNDETALNYSVVGAQDFAWLTTNYYLAGSKDDALSSARITFARESDTNNLLGPLKATEFEVGDILPVGNTRGASRNLGRGLRFSNTPLVSSLDGRKVNLTGDMQDGWDVELYRNGILINQKFGVADGRYEFNDIELEFGENSFELVFYGPQGQVETKTEVFNIDSNSVAKGQFNYQFSAVEANKSVFGLEEENYGASAEEKGPQANLVAGYGVSDWLSFTTGAGVFKPDLGEELVSYDIGLNANLFGVALLTSTLEEVKDSVRSTNHSIRTKAFDTALSFSYLDRTPLGLERLSREVVTDSYTATMSGRLFGSSALALNFQNEWRKDNNATDIVEAYRNSLGVNGTLGSVSHSLELRKRTELTPLQPLPVTADSFADPVYLQQFLARIAEERDQPLAERNVLPETLTGGLQYRKSFHSVFTRLFANYSLKPDSELISYGASFSYPFSPDLTSNLSVFRYTLNDQVAANLGLNWRLDDVYLSATTSYNNVNGWSGGLNARFGFGYNDNAGYFASNSGVSQTGAVSARVFEDKNLNGVMDENESVLKNAEVKALQGGQRAVTTNSQGIAVLTGLAANLKTDIVVDRASFEDPTMKTLIPGVALTGRRGYIEHIDFPVSSTGELEGTLYLSTGGGEMEPAAFAGIQLIDSNGKVVDTAQSEYDGYYLFVDVVPGQYKVLIDKSFTKRRNLRLSDPVYLAVRGGEVINGSDIMLQSKEVKAGYAAEMGSFTSLSVLKAYWGLLVRSGMNVAKLRPFYLQDENTAKYVLRAGFYPEQHKADEVCERIKGRKLACVVRPLETRL